MEKSQGGQACDASWCNCDSVDAGTGTDLFSQRWQRMRSCAAHNKDEGCDLCEQKYLFVLSAGGRTGSTSLLEGLNALPGVSLSGENFGVLEDLRAAYDKASDAVRRNGDGNSPAAYYVPQPQGLLKHSLCVQQSMVTRLADAGEDEADAAAGAAQIRGFKELLQLPSLDAGGEFASEYPHLSTRPEVRREWVEYLETLFPCSRIVLNLRRDRAAQAQGILDSFFDTNGDPLSAPPLDRIEKELEMVSRFMLEWHGNKSATGRSFLMYTEDMDAQRFTELAQWLGQPCTFGAAPNANEYDPTLGGALVGSPYFHHSKAAVDVSCGKPGIGQAARESAKAVEAEHRRWKKETAQGEGVISERKPEAAAATASNAAPANPTPPEASTTGGNGAAGCVAVAGSNVNDDWCAQNCGPPEEHCPSYPTMCSC